MKQQISHSMTGYFDRGNQTKREQFLAEMGRVVPWARLMDLIEPYYPKGDQGAGGRPPLPLATALRVYFLQQWYNLSDPAAEETLYDPLAMPRFAGVVSDADVIPDESSILRFRRLLETHKLTEQLFAEANRHLGERGLLLGKGTIVDATVVNTPSSTKNASGKRDSELHQTKKGNQWYFGMKAHTGTDAEHGLVHTVVCTAANVHDATVVGKLLYGREDAMYGDSAYRAKESKQMAEDCGMDYKVCERAKHGRLLTERHKQRNRAISRIRAFGEHPYLVAKRLWGHVKVRYRGIAKNYAQMCMLFALANLYRVRHRLLAT